MAVNTHSKPVTLKLTAEEANTLLAILWGAQHHYYAPNAEYVWNGATEDDIERLATMVEEA